MNIIFLGAPGSGKGTQASLLSKNLDIESIATGDLLRKEVEKNSRIGNIAKEQMESGALVSDEVVIDIIKEKIITKNCEKGFILDGFPRNINQALKLEEMLHNCDKKINKVFNFEVEEDVLVKRIAGRYICKKCGAVYNRYFKPTIKDGKCDNCDSNEFETRSDDNELTVKNRLKVYKESSFPLIEYYKKKHLLVSIDALKISTLVFEDLKSNINN
jgi:adenylate kinase